MRMSGIFAVLVGVALAGLLAALYTGIISTGSLIGSGLETHRKLALGGAILVVLVHSVVFVYLIGTGRAIKDATRDHDVDPDLYREHVGYKWRAAPWALACTVATVATSVLGGALEGGEAGWLHPLAAVVTLLCNLFGLPAEYRAIRDNGGLLDRLAMATRARNLVKIAAGQDPAPPLSPLSPTGWFLVMAVSAWLPWLYVRFIMGRSELPALPFAVVSAVFLAGFLAGALRWRPPG